MPNYEATARDCRNLAEIATSLEAGKTDATGCCDGTFGSEQEDFTDPNGDTFGSAEARDLLVQKLGGGEAGEGRLAACRKVLMRLSMQTGDDPDAVARALDGALGAERAHLATEVARYVAASADPVPTDSTA